MASTPPTDPDPRTAADDDEDATPIAGTKAGVPTQSPAEGDEDADPRQPGSPQG